jgi:hypothetical protein
MKRGVAMGKGFLRVNEPKKQVRVARSKPLVKL